MKIYKIARTHGKTLPETGYQYKKVRIYRALRKDIRTINNMDYITLNKKWAEGHADHMTVTEGATYVVLSTIVDAKDVAEAYNPGEYFYVGQPVSGQIVYETKDENT